MKIWRLKQGADRRIRSGHPWIFSNELTESPKGHDPGTPIRLEDSKGQFVALGYGNPHSLIAFRALSFDSAVKDVFAVEFLVDKLVKAWRSRAQMGYQFSFRLCFGEGDYFPGLVVDRYVVKTKKGLGQVLVAQILTAGVERAIGSLDFFFQALIERTKMEGLSKFGVVESAVVIRNDVAVRKLEGLTFEQPKILFGTEFVQDPELKMILHSSWQWNEPFEMAVDLLNGQKTGFFLDQAWNIQIVAQLLQNSVLAWRGRKRTIRILDLCCYVGQWSAKLSLVAERLGLAVEVTLVDVSAEALKIAEQNVKANGIESVICHKMDVMEDLPRLSDRGYDIVIADPPAFVKAKKDLPTGSHAYLKLNTHGFRLLNSGGWLISCSCSGLFKEEDLINALSKAARRDGREIRCIGKGGHSPDHPVLTSFPEGFYLKMLIHQAL